MNDRQRSYHVWMSILNFITQDELDDLDEDPRMAFMHLVNTAQRSLAKQTEKLDLREEDESFRYDELRHSFMNVVIAAAKRFEIEPFVSMEVPRFETYRRGSDHREFQSELDHYITQLVLDNSIRSKRDSVVMLPSTKEQIRKYVRGLRECLEKADLSDTKREALLAKLEVFEAELEKRRLSTLAVARITFEILAIPGAVWATGEVATRLATNLMAAVAQAQATERETRDLPSPAPFKALSPPRKEITHQAKTQASPRRYDDLDDDIPF